MDELKLAQIVSLACHDIRTPLASVEGVAKLLVRQAALGESDARLVALIDAAAGEIAALLEQLSLAGRIAEGRYEPPLQQVDTLELARSSDARVSVAGRGETVSTDPEAVSDALAGLAAAALRHGGLGAITWTVAGRSLSLSPLPDGTAAVFQGSSGRDLSALVARVVLEALGARLAPEGDTLRVELGP